MLVIFFKCIWCLLSCISFVGLKWIELIFGGLVVIVCFKDCVLVLLIVKLLVNEVCIRG